MHEKVSGVWKTMPTAHEKVSGNYKAFLSGWERVSGVWKQFYTAVNFIVYPGAYIGGGVLGSDASSEITFNTDGTITFVGLQVPTTPGGFVSQWWSAGSTPGIGTGKYVRLSYVSGDALNGSGSLSAGVWYELSAARKFAMSQTYSGIRSGVFDLQFSNDGSTVAVEDEITLTADATTGP